ncbi:MAG: hypothetical protein Q8L86_11370 [Vicinamibacterales bacterium]|nr:hypothetical protein [Vicinamibacterales bacterium]
MTLSRQYRAGQSVEDHCRSCHEDRTHTVIVVDAQAQPLRVSCDLCRSEHNYRGGPRFGGPRSPSTGAPPARAPQTPPAAFPLVSPRERQAPPMPHDAPTDDLELLIRRIIREETGLTPVAPAEKWRGGALVLQPGKPGVQEKRWPIESFFHKVVMLRNRLRTLEQQVNASDLPDDQKLKIQSYITGCYGSLTSFNVLFADEDDRFVGAAQD